MNDLIAQLLLGPLFLIIGLIFKVFPPKKINDLYGYRSPRSKKSQVAWDASNKLSSNLFILISMVTIVVQFALYPFMSAGVQLSVSCAVLIILLFGTIPYVEKYLKNNFDEDGNPISHSE